MSMKEHNDINEYFVYFEGKLSVSAVFLSESGTKCYEKALEYGNEVFGATNFIIKCINKL